MANSPDAYDALLAVSKLKDQITYALAGDEPSDLLLVRELCLLHTEALWCRDAVLAWARRDHEWAQITEATGIADSTLQSRLSTWMKREAEK